VDRPSTNASYERDQLSAALAQVAGGSRAALEDVYRRTSAKLFGICLRILPERSEAEDALQEIYLNVWRRAGSFDPAKASPITWLAALARNRSIDRLRALRSKQADGIEGAMAVADDRPSAFDSLESAEDGRRMAGCLDELEARQNEAIRASFYGGANYPELAEKAGVPLGTMKSWIRRGLLKLKGCLER
jgi:RNA polymerase sigma-70 factor (ECF subfamily)